MLDINSTLGWQTKTPQRSEIFLVTGNSISGGGTIRNFLTLLKRVGGAITYVKWDGVTIQGDRFQINEDGVYSIGYSDAGNAGGPNTSYYFAITLNQTNLSTGAASIPETEVLATALVYGGPGGEPGPMHISSTTNLKRGDIVRCCISTSSLIASGNAVAFRITKVSD